jgi:hypothetical protein
VSRAQIMIAGVPYPLARKPPRDARQFTVTPKAWQPGMPADKETALWQLDGPQLQSYESVGEGNPAGRLGVAWADGVDTRWANLLTLGPLVNTITLTGLDTSFPPTFLDVGSMLDVNTGLDAPPVQGMARAIAITQGTTPGDYYLYFVRDGFVTKVDVATMEVISSTPLLDSAVDVIATQTPSGVREVSVALQSSPYQVAYPLNSGAADTWTVNGGGEIATVFGLSNDGRVVSQAVSGGQLKVRGNLLTSVQTMLAPAWARVTEIVGTQLAPKGFITEGYRWFMSTTKGPFPLDPQLAQTYALIPEMDNNSETGLAGFWSFLGAIFGSRYGVRWQKGGTGRSFGVETFSENRTPVQGYPTAFDSSTRWHYQAVYNVTTDTTWLLAWAEDGREWRPGVRVSPFVIAKIAGNAQVRAMKWIGTANQERTTQVLTFGVGTNAGYIIVGETPQEIDDSNYRYAAEGTLYGTELRRFPHLLKDLEALEFETEDCDTGRTITVGGVFSGDSAQPTTVTLNGSTTGVNNAVTTNGYQRRLFVDNSGVPLTTASGRRFYPTVALAATPLTNYITNPSIESGATTGWSFGTAGGLASTTVARYGTYSCSISRSGGLTGIAQIPITLVANTTYVSRVDVYVSSANSGTDYTVSISGLTGATGNLSATVTAPTLDGWQTVEIGPFTTASDVSGTFGVTLTADGALYFDGAMVVNASAQMDYFDGSFTGDVWTGTEFLSTSTQSSVSPRIVGPLRAYYTLRPILIEEIVVWLELRDDDPRGTAYDRVVALQALQNSGPVLVADDYFGNSYYVRVANVPELPEVSDDGAGPDSPKRGHVFQIPITLHRWVTTGTGVTP